MEEVKPDDVLGVGDFSLNPEEITPFIDIAEVVVEDNLLGKGLSDKVLNKIWLYLSAHFTALKDQQIEQSRVLDSSYQYEGRTEMGFNFTRFGQTAMLLDTTNTLNKLNNPPKKASIKSV